VTATNSDESSWARWLQEQLDLRGWQDVDVSKRSGGSIASSQMTRWLNKGRRPDRESVRKVCAVLDVPRVRGMIAAGYIDPADIGVTVVEETNLANLERRELVARGRAVLEELARRIPDGAQDGATVTRLPAHPDDDGLYADGVIFGPPSGAAHRDSQ
jgi:hypothetical protein